MSSPFPQELIDIIIDFLHDDKPSLYACSLVCHNWLETSRIHKFSSCIVSNQQSLNECPFSTPYLRKIRLTGYSHTLPFNSFKRISLPALRFASADETTIPNMLEQLSVFPIYNLEELRLFRCKFENAQHLVDFICSFPSLNSLFISQVGWDGKSAENMPACSGKTSLPPLKGELRVLEPTHKPGNRYAQQNVWYEKPLLPILASLFSSGKSRFQSIVISAQTHSVGHEEEITRLLKSSGSNLKVLDLANMDIMILVRNSF